MKTTRLVALELFLVLLLAGCANLRVDQACRAAIEKETKVLAANGHTMRHHRTSGFPLLLSAAENREQVGDYQSCLNILQMAHIGRPMYRGSSGNYVRIQRTYSQSIPGQSGGYQSYGGGGSIDAAHHAAGHTHHHGH